MLEVRALPSERPGGGPRVAWPRLRPPALRARLRCRPRVAWSRTTLRSRTDSGVTSTHSSSEMNSRACSSESRSGGVRRMASSAEAERMLVCFFSLVGLTSISSSRAFSPDHHALVDLGARPDQQDAPLLEAHQGVAGGHAPSVGHHGAVALGLQLAVPRLPSVEDVVEHAGAPGLGHELGPEPDEAPGRHPVVHADPSGPVVDHLDQGPLAQGHQLGDHAQVVVGDVDGHPLHGLVELPVDLPGDHLGLAHGELEPLPAHGLHQHGQLQLAPALDLPGVGPLGRAGPAARRCPPARRRAG